MMTISMKGIGKRYANEWILKGVNAELKSGNVYAIKGANGSGKSTFMKLVSGYLTPSIGQIRYTHDSKEVKRDEIYSFVSYSAPYIELIEEFTLLEAIEYHAKFKRFMTGYDPKHIVQLLGFQAYQYKFVNEFSSGMKQRLHLALSLYSESPILLLDEPTSFLDNSGKIWFEEQLQRNHQGRLVVIASNDDSDFKLCNAHYTIEAQTFKQS